MAAKSVLKAAVVAYAGLAGQLTLADEAVPTIPLTVGLNVVFVSHTNEMDYEFFDTVISTDDRAITFNLHRVDLPDGASGDGEAIDVVRVVEWLDMREANRMNSYFHTEDPEDFPGSTAFQTSAAVLSSLKRGEPTPFVLGLPSGPLGMFGSRKYFRGDLVRVEPEAIMVPVLLNGKQALLPAVHARGMLKVGNSSGMAEFLWLDQPDNALALLAKFEENEIRVIRIDTPYVDRKQAVADLTKDVSTDQCRAELSGVYFDTGSAALLAQSSGEIDRVVTMMLENPEWQFTIEGHTDNIGTDADNLTLAQNRANAVVAALTDNGVETGKLIAIGYGEAKPIDSNDTIDGRARNRRVELSRLCE